MVHSDPTSDCQLHDYISTWWYTLQFKSAVSVSQKEILCCRQRIALLTN